MGKLQKLIQGTASLLNKPSLINLVLEDQEVNRKKVNQTYGFFNGLPRIEISSLTDKNEFLIHPYTFLEGGSLPTDYLLLCVLAEKFKECVYFEIGTWRGESAMNVSRYAQEIFTLNLSEEQMRSKGWDEKYIQLHGFFSKSNPKIKHLTGDSMSFDFSFLEKKCDLIFIDGDHHYEAVRKDTENCLRLRKNENSIIVWHDYGVSTESTRWEVLRGILDAVPKENHRHLYAVNNTLCAVYLPHEIFSFEADFPQTPAFDFELNIKLKKIT